MKAVYRREMKHNYLIMEPEETGYDCYEIHMMAANRIGGLLKFHVKQVDNQKFYYYEITSKQPLNRVLEYHSLGREELKKLIEDIGRTLERLEAYLLKENQILLEPEYIYVEPEQFTVSLCLVPGRQVGFPEEMTGLLRYLLGKVNHQDKECVVMAYGLYQESLKENYGMKDLLEIAGKNCSIEKGSDESVLQAERDNKTEENHSSHLSYSFTEEIEERKRFSDGKINEVVFIIPILAMFGIATALWLVFGMEGIRKFWYGVPITGGFSAFAVLAVWRIESSQPKEMMVKKKERGRQPAEGYDWQLTFEEEIKEKTPKPDTGDEEVFQTALLNDTTADKCIRYLRAVGADMEDIAITYVPYLIGKQEGMVDCVLTGEAISRIHARIDREGEEYRISDLNSTNGTAVNGRVLETNETVLLKIGDEVFIANYPFIFT
ncbi:DUF6382 domain-containing protein [Lacrimispora sp.]|uniref:DUF6382 domain-containing protein n=1 Tax=Lacrimispora sp. TaxID=2719234 RepID=UPI00289A7C1A|nr:DUF6382 domain-containing protein [Lacrimispora sp.]